MSERQRIFSYEEALETFPRVREVTAAAVRRVEALVDRNQSRTGIERQREDLEQEVETVVQNWATEIIRLGCEVKGLWLVDWDNGDGFYCWRYPEPSISYFHTYEEGFAGRVPIN